MLVNYKKSFFDAVKIASVIGDEIVIQWNGTNAVVSHINSNMGCIMKASSSIWDYPEEVIIGKFGEFNNIVSLDYPVLDIDETSITLKTDVVTIKYLQTNEEVISPSAFGDKEYNFGSIDFSFVMTPADLSKLKKLIKYTVNVEDKSSSISSVATITTIPENNKIKLSVNNTSGYGSTGDSSIGNSLTFIFDSLQKIEDVQEYKISPQTILDLPMINDYTFRFKNEHGRKAISAVSEYIVNNEKAADFEFVLSVYE